MKLEQILYSENEYSLNLFLMKTDTPISHVTKKSDVMADIQDPLSVVYRLMKRNNLMYIPVTDQGKIVGVISRKAIKRLGFGYVYEGRDDVETGMFDILQADQVMDKDLPQINAQATVREVAELMATHDFAALPVIHGDTPLGVVDINDILLFLIEGH